MQEHGEDKQTGKVRYFPGNPITERQFEVLVVKCQYYKPYNKKPIEDEGTVTGCLKLFNHGCARD